MSRRHHQAPFLSPTHIGLLGGLSGLFVSFAGNKLLAKILDMYFDEREADAAQREIIKKFIEAPEADPKDYLVDPEQSLYMDGHVTNLIFFAMDSMLYSKWLEVCTGIYEKLDAKTPFKKESFSKDYFPSRDFFNSRLQLSEAEKNGTFFAFPLFSDGKLQCVISKKELDDVRGQPIPFMEIQFFMGGFNFSKKISDMVAALPASSELSICKFQKIKSNAPAAAPAPSTSSSQTRPPPTREYGLCILLLPIQKKPPTSDATKV